MGGMAVALGSMVSTAGSAIGSTAGAIGSGIAAGAKAVGSGIAEGAGTIGGGIAEGAKAVGNFGGEAVDFVSGKAKLAGDWMKDNAVDPAFGLGQKTIDGVADIGSELYKNAKDDLSKSIDAVTVKNEDGSTNYWKTGSNVGYKLAKEALLSSMSGGGKKSQQLGNTQAEPVQAGQFEASAPNAEDELNKLMRNGQQ